MSLHGLTAAATQSCLLSLSFTRSNNEIGSIQPVKEIAAAVHQKHPSILVHTDAAQSVGKVDVGVWEI